MRRKAGLTRNAILRHSADFLVLTMTAASAGFTVWAIDTVTDIAEAPEWPVAAVLVSVACGYFLRKRWKQTVNSAFADGYLLGVTDRVTSDSDI